MGREGVHNWPIFQGETISLPFCKENIRELRLIILATFLNKDMYSNSEELGFTLRQKSPINLQ